MTLSLLQNPLHTAEEMQQISNLAHWLEGAVLGVAALVIIAESRGRLQSGGGPYTWPILILLAGVFLLGYLVIPHHGLELARTQWRFVFGDPQQRQHLVFAALMTLGASAEVLHRAGRVKSRSWLLIWPAAIAVVGIMFGVHTQHGTAEAVVRATLVHRFLGVLFVAVALLRTAEVRWPSRARTLELTWGFALLLAALLLFVYREPEGSYQHEHGAGQMIPTTAIKETP